MGGLFVSSARRTVVSVGAAALLAGAGVAGSADASAVPATPTISTTSAKRHVPSAPERTYVASRLTPDRRVTTSLVLGTGSTRALRPGAHVTGVGRLAGHRCLGGVLWRTTAAKPAPQRLADIGCAAPDAIVVDLRPRRGETYTLVVSSALTPRSRAATTTGLLVIDGRLSDRGDVRVTPGRGAFAHS